MSLHVSFLVEIEDGSSDSKVLLYASPLTILPLRCPPPLSERAEDPKLHSDLSPTIDSILSVHANPFDNYAENVRGLLRINILA